jgi:hypothetical protein
MAKQLVERGNIEQFINQGETTFYVDQTLLLTPGAKDYLREKGITLVYGERPATVAQPAAAPAAVEKPRSVAAEPELRVRIGEMLKNDFAIRDRRHIEDVTRKVMDRLRIHR